jgi:HD-like signal output (HDOD) protein
MSPEQCLGDTHLDHRSDIYSLGVVLFQLLTGRLPFTAETAGRLIMSHVQEMPPSPQVINPALSTAASAVILRAMAKKPDQRFASMREFRDAVLLAAGMHAGATTMSDEALAHVLTPPPVSLAPASSTLLASAATTYSPTPTPVVMTPAPKPVTARPQPLPPAQPPIAPRTNVFTLAPAPLPFDKSAMIDGLVEAVKTRTAPDADLDLPQVPRSILRCLDLLGAPDFSFGGMATLVNTDARLASQLVQVANTSGTLSRSTEQAISRLGAEGMRTGLFEIALRPLLESPSARLQAVCKQPWQHALAVALIAQRLVHARGADERSVLRAYRAGLFHDAGKPIAATLLFDIERVMTNAKGRKIISEDMLVTCLDRCHARAGSRLARSWGLSPEAALAIEQAVEPTPTSDLAKVLRLANALSFKAGFHTRRDELDKSRLLIDEARRAVGFDEETCHRAIEGIKDAVARKL